MTDFPRLIEFAFPLKETSLDSVHEKNVRHGHISTLHIWPARRPLAACRAALIATLLPDPGDAEKRKELCEKIAGKVVKKVERKKMPNGQIVERIKEETVGGILHWGRETENAATLEWFRQEIRKAYGGRAPKVLDPFAGGGAIPLEAMRLGCEATAVDINPVAWFILKCTLEYPQKLAGQTRPLPEFILHNDAFMAEFFKKAKGYGKAEINAALKQLHDRFKKKPKRNRKEDQASFQFQQEAGESADELQADLAWHVRAWGQWVLDRARRELAQYYPTYADFEPITKDDVAYEHQPMRLVPLKADGTADIDGLNAEFTQDYLDDKRNPRWVAKPTVAYLWARTVTCKNCRATVPLLKTRWLCKKANKRVLLTMEPNAERTGVLFGVQTEVPSQGGNAAQKREHDKQIGLGTMSRSGAKCPCCGIITAISDIQAIGQSIGLPEELTCAVIDAANGRQYRAIVDADRHAWSAAEKALAEQEARDDFGPINHPIDARRPSPNSRGLSGLPKYGITSFSGVFNERQQLGLFVFARLANDVRDAIARDGTSLIWADGVSDYLSLPLGKLADYSSKGCTWNLSREGIGHTFTRFALPMTTDYAEMNLTLDAGGGYGSAAEYAAATIDRILPYVTHGCDIHVVQGSATSLTIDPVDLVVTDPPYYDSIPYSDISDYFYIWLRRAVGRKYQEAFKTDLVVRDEELIQHAGRCDGDNHLAKSIYEGGMVIAFQECQRVLSAEGRLVIVFAHKKPDAWETLASALIRSGFVVDSSWPIQTERDTRFTSQTGSGLASSVWLVCKKRPATAKPGWDNIVLEEMRTNIAVKLREFWDAGIRGPDFVWAATGPAMEAYSKHPVVRKANEPNTTMGVGEFLNHVRRMVVDYIVGQVLTGEQGADITAADRLDEVSAYYLLHRHDFGLDEAPVGACILYATACGLSDSELDKTWDILLHAGSKSSSDDDMDGNDAADDSDGDADDEPAEDTSGGSQVKLKTWNQRRSKSMGYEAPTGKAVPLIDRIHRVMHLWKDGDVQKVDEFLDQHALRRNELFKRVVQSLIELSTNSERSLLESISNHIGAKGAIKDRGPLLFQNEGDE